MDFISLISQKILSHTGIIVNSIQYDLIKDFVEKKASAANCTSQEFAENNMVAQNGHVYFAPADYHLLMKINLENKIVLELNHDEQINFLRPAVDKMFFYASNLFTEKCMAVLRTGLGTDEEVACGRI